jgi:hypothetical protein
MMNQPRPSVAVGRPPIREYELERTFEHPKKPLNTRGQLPIGVIKASQVRYPETISPARASAEQVRAIVFFRLNFLTC